MVQGEEVCVVMVPFLSQGHINPLLQLSRLIAAYNIPVHFFSATTHVRQAKVRVHCWDPLTVANIHFHEFPLPSLPNPPPNPNAITRFPNHIIPSFKAVIHLREPFKKLLTELSTMMRRVVIVHDSLMSYVVQDSDSVPNSEIYMFKVCSAFTAFWFQWEEKQALKLDDETLKLDDETESVWKKVPSLEDCYSSDLIELLNSEVFTCKNISSGTVYNTSRVFEDKYLELLKKSEDTKNWAIGPFNPVVIKCKEDSSTESIKIVNWLDKQEPNSVIYVSFGTTVSFADEETKAFAIGLEESGHKFIWVVREADKSDIFDKDENRKLELPEGYEERVERKGLGLVVRGWAPQLEILGHPSTGGFMSHCGWNSCMEGISTGVPIATWPMHSDQPRNAMLITDFLGIGIHAREWGRRGEIVTSSLVTEAVRRLMASEEGCRVRKTATELGVAVRQSVEEGGVMGKELDAFVAEITK